MLCCCERSKALNHSNLLDLCNRLCGGCGRRIKHRKKVTLTLQRGTTLSLGLSACYLLELCLWLLLGRSGHGLYGGYILQVTEERGEIELEIELLEECIVGLTHRERRLIKLDGRIQTNCCQLLREEQFIAPLRNIFTCLATNLIGICKDILGRAPLSNEFRSTLLANAWHTWDIIRGIAPQRQYIAHQHRVAEAILSLNCRAVGLHDIIALLVVYHTLIVNKLTIILIGSHHEHVVARSCATLCECADDIIRLEALHLENGYAHRLQQTLHIGHRDLDILGRGWAVSLVLGEYLAAETTPWGVECHTNEVGLLALQKVAQELSEAKDHRGVHAVTTTHGAPHKGVVVFVYQRIGIYQE